MGSSTLAVDLINHPPHYTSHPSGVESIEVARFMSFNVGNAWKYLMRADHKGTRDADMKKAEWYLKDELANGESLPRRLTNHVMSRFYAVIGSEPNERIRYIFTCLMEYQEHGSIVALRRATNTLSLLVKETCN